MNTRYHRGFDIKIFYQTTSNWTEKRVLIIEWINSEHLLKISNEEEKDRKIKAFRDALSDPANPYEDWLEHADKLIKIKLNGRASQPYSAADIVGEIIVKVMDDIRTWDMERVPDINKFMYMQIRGVVDNKYQKERRLVSREKFNPDDGSFSVIDEMELKLELSEILKDQDIREAFSLCFKEIEEDTEMGVVFLSWSEGNESQEMAKDFGLTVKQVEAIKQKIRRKLKKINLSLN